MRDKTMNSLRYEHVHWRAARWIFDIHGKAHPRYDGVAVATLRCRRCLAAFLDVEEAAQHVCVPYGVRVCADLAHPLRRIDVAASKHEFYEALSQMFAQMAIDERAKPTGDASVVHPRHGAA